ncbi:MAG: DUF2203 domain-containing protein [Calditrichaceae bacterium]
MYVYNKHFSVEEAASYIDGLRKTLKDIQVLAEDLKKTGFDPYNGKYKIGFHPGTYKEYPDDFIKLLELIRNITEKGIEIKGLEHGLIDFPAIRPNGDEVFLCWKVDEQAIEFWHTLDGGYRGRHHIDDF